MMASKHEDGSNKQAEITEGALRNSELHPDANHDDNKPTTEGVVSGLQVHLEAKHDNNEPIKEDTVSYLEVLAEATDGDNEPTKEGTVSGLEVLAEATDGDNELTKEGTVSGLELLSEAKHDDHEAIVEGKNKSSSSSSTTGDPLELISGEDDLLDDSSIKSDLPQSPRSECASPPDVSAQTPQWSMVSASPRAGPGNSFSRELLPPTPEWSMSGSSLMKSPIPQIMGRPTGYDPNRIPSSIFSTRSTTPMEWSVASNESLFSIHMGNSSFSREHIFMLGDGKPEEWTNSSLHMQNGSEGKSESNNFITNLPPVFEAASENDKKSVDKRAESPAEESRKSPEIIPGETVKEKLSAGAQEAHLFTNSSNLSECKGVTPVDGTRYSVSAPRVSNESGNSSGSFAFPVLDTNEGGKSASPKAIAEKPEKPQSKPQHPPTPPKAACCSWFSCFSCWPRCC